MAQKYIVRCKDATQTSGTGTLTLDNSTAANWQTPAQAVARTLLANGDTVRYTISDTSDPVLYEEGIGTIGSNGLTLTRDTVRQSSSGTSKISWPSGGARDVVISWSPGDVFLTTDTTVARTNAANTFTLNQDANTVQNVVNVNTGVSAAALWQAQSNAAAVSLVAHGSGRTTVRFGASIGSRNELLGVTGGVTVGTLGAANLVFGTNSAKVAEITSAGVFQDASGNKYDAFPSGTPILFGAPPPAGWTRVNVAGSRFPRIADTADSPGGLGAASLSGLTAATTVNAYTLTLADIPGHTHGITATQSAGGATIGPANRITDHNSGVVTSVQSGSAGGGGGHAHTASTTVNSASASLTPAYEIWVKATKN